MALAILGLLVGPVTEVVKLVGKPILRQFNYLCCFNSNKQDLIEKAEKLKEKKEEVQSRVSAAENNVEEILPATTTWLREVDEIQGKNDDIDNHIRDVKSGCLAAKSRFLLSRRVKKTAEDMEKLLQECPKSNEPISRPRLPPSMQVPDIPERPAPEFESRKQIEDGVMANLKDEKVSVMGICGMGGLGKTTLAEKIKDRVKVEHLFGESVMAVVSQQPDEFKIQAELAENLGLDLKDITALSSRAHKLHARLTEGGKRILVILDDVWKDLKLKNLGIEGKGGPHGCTILLTSRDRDVLTRMDAQPICEMKILSEKEAWSLFQQNVGACLYDQTLLSTAQDVVKECKGLPLALVTVARALKGHGKHTWHKVLQGLKASNPEDLETVLKDVYTPLKLSYDFLTENAKSIFLLCCLFPEDSDIPLEILTAYAMGLRMFEENSSLKEVTTGTYSFVEDLKSRCLLLEGKNEHHVRMHDVVRDVAIFIASKEKQLIRCGDKCVWISSFSGERNELSKTVNFPNLRLLLIQGDKWEINDKHFEGAINLNVLSMSGIYSLKSSLPRTIISLKCLQTLILDDMRLETISVVGDLENLEIFICRKCPHIKMLPAEIGRLVRLKLLEFSNCHNLKRVAPGIISSLVGLENLKMIYSFNGWESERSDGKNAALSELQSLSSLTYLTIEIEDSRLVAEHFKLPQHVEKYEIFISSHLHDYPKISSDREFERKMCMTLAEKEITPSGNWFAECVSRVECMWLKGEGSNIVDLRQVHQNMRALSLKESSGVEKLVNMSSSIGSTATVFPQLEYLHLQLLSNLEEICHIDGPFQDGSSIAAFHNLKTLHLETLPALKHWWKSSPYQQNAPLPQLQELDIRDCEMMEQVFLWTEEKNENEIGKIVVFPKLKLLRLSKLPKLTSFSKGIFEGVGFPLLTQVEIEECPQLKSLVSNYHDEDEDSSHLFSKLVVSSDRLERFVIRSCGKIRSLFSSSIGQNLRNLNELIINDCREMIRVFEDDKGQISRVFPKLQKLEMIGMPKLKEFCESAQMDFPLLREVSILGCSEMERLSLGSVSAPNLKALRVGFKDIAINTGQDLNAELQQHLSKAKVEESFYKWVLKVNKMERMGELWMDFKKRGNCLVLVIMDSTQAAEQISFPSDILRYEITIGTIRNYIVSASYDRTMKLNLPTNIILGNWIHQCVRSVEYMLLEGKGSNNLDLGQAQNIRELTLGDCLTVKKLVNIIPPSIDGVRDHLEFLNIVNFPSLEEIYPTPEESSFNILKELYLKDLPALKHLWKSNSPNATILQLEKLWIMNCEMMEQIFSWNDENDIGSRNHPITMIFPNLIYLKLSNLPRLKGVCNGIIESIKLPRLSSLYIEGCPQLKNLVSTVNDNRKMNSEGIDNGADQCLHIFCEQAEKVDFSGIKTICIGEIENISSIWCHQILIKDFFAGLENLIIYKLDKLRSLFSPSIVTNFNNLSNLDIEACGEMVEVIEDDNKVDTDASSEMTTVCVFPKLKYLNMKALPKLEMFCGWKSCALELPSLVEVWIYSCPEMKRFSLGCASAQYQTRFKINRKEVINHTQDLNIMLQQPIFRGELED